MCIQPFLNALLMAQFTDSLIHDVSSWLLQAEGWSSGSKMVVVNKSSNVRESGNALASKAVKKAFMNIGIANKR